jgi:outer membrane lipoprotein
MRRTTGATPGKWASLWLWIFFLAGLPGCMQPISKDVMATVDRDQTFPVVIKNPKAYIGSIVLWGGVIEKVLHGPEGTKLIVIQSPLDAKEYPQTDATYGKFVAHTPQSLDPLIFREGMKITLAGELDGVQEKELGPEDVPHPMVRVIEIHAWTERGKSFRIR